MVVVYCVLVSQETGAAYDQKVEAPCGDENPGGRSGVWICRIGVLIEPEATQARRSLMDEALEKADQNIRKEEFNKTLDSLHRSGQLDGQYHKDDRYGDRREDRRPEKGEGRNRPKRKERREAAR